MFQTIRNAWKVEDIRRKMLFTLFIILIYRIGNAITVPFVNTSLLAAYFNSMQNTVLGLYNVMSGSAFSMATIFALSIQPYINASIIIQLLCIAIPALERLSKEGGEEGKEKIQNITRYSTVGIALIQGFGYYVLIKQNNALMESGAGFWAALVIILSFVAGSSLLMWMGEQITEFGIGNGISIILLVNIVSTMPADYSNLFEQFVKGASSVGMAVLAAIIIVALTVAVVAFIVYLNDGERRISVQYSQKIVGRKSFGGQASHIPLKVNTAGVIPIIFAVSLFQFPVIIANFATNYNPGTWTRFFISSYWCRPGYPIYTLGLLLYIALIIFFAYFYTQITFNPAEVSNNIKKQGGFVPGIRPGKPTEEYFSRVLRYLIFIGAVGLIIIAVIPMIVSGVFNAQLSFAGTSLIIVVGVILETAKKLESMLLVRNYSGFLAK